MRPVETIGRLTAVLLMIAILTAGCSTGSDGTTVTVYSPSGLGSWYAAQFEAFTKETGIKVALFEAGSGEVVSRVNSRAVWERLDGDNSVAPADLLVTLPPFIQKAEKAGLLQAAGVPIANTALCFIANSAVSPAPVTWNDLLRPDLKGRLQYSTPGDAGDGTALLLLLQQQMGKKGALDYLAALQANNVGPSPSTGTLQSKVNSGELLVANGDVQMNLASINNDGSTFRIFFPAMPDKSRTTVALSYVAGVTATARYPDEAGKLLAFLLSDSAQKSLFSDAFGIPVRETIAAEMTAGAGPGAVTPVSVLNGVRLWTPDWNTALAELESDVAAYKAAIGG